MKDGQCRQMEKEKNAKAQVSEAKKKDKTPEKEVSDSQLLSIGHEEATSRLLIRAA